jgi:hypothetical protein
MEQTILAPFLLKIGEIPRKLGLVDENQAGVVLAYQAKAQCLALADENWKITQDGEGWKNPYGNEHLPAMLVQIDNDYKNSSITVDQYQQVYGKIGDKDYEKELKKSVPYMKDLLLATGAINQKQVDPLLAAQGAARTIELVQNLGAKAKPKLDDALGAVRFLKKDSTEPDYVRAAQSTNYFADVLAAALKESKVTMTPAIENALLSCEMLASQSIKRASEAMAATPGHGPEAAKRIAELRTAVRHDVDVYSKTLATSVHVSRLRQGLEAVAAKLPGEQRATLNAAINDHLPVIKELKVQGSLVQLPLPQSWCTRVKMTPPSSGQSKSL